MATLVIKSVLACVGLGTCLYVNLVPRAFCLHGRIGEILRGVKIPGDDVVRLSQLVENGAGYEFEPAYTSRLATVHPSFPTSLRVNLEPENTITQRYVKWRMPPSYSTDGAGTSNNSSWVGYIYIYINIYVTVVIATDETFIY